MLTTALSVVMLGHKNTGSDFCLQSCNYTNQIECLQVPLPLHHLFMSQYKVSIAYVLHCTPEKDVVCVFSSAMGKSVGVTGASHGARLQLERVC